MLNISPVFYLVQWISSSIMKTPVKYRTDYIFTNPYPWRLLRLLNNLPKTETGFGCANAMSLHSWKVSFNSPQNLLRSSSHLTTRPLNALRYSERSPTTEATATLLDVIEIVGNNIAMRQCFETDSMINDLELNHSSTEICWKTHRPVWR